MPFTKLGLGPQITKAIKDAGYTEPTPIQTRAVPPILAGKDTIGIAQTGTGKTAAFVWPLIERLSQTVPVAGGREMARVLVLTPTRELAAQVEENLRNYARYLPLKSAIIFGGVSMGPQVSALRQGVDLVVATPGRLLDHMGQGNVRFPNLETLVLDEADRMLDMGFLPDIKRIMQALPKKRQTLLFSATFSKEIEQISAAFLSSPVSVEVSRRASPAESVMQSVYEIHKARKMSLLLHLLQDETMNCVLLFSRTKHGADKIARRLADAGVKTSTLHSNRSQNQRLQALHGFKKGYYRVLVATDIAARGIDVDGISHVVNYDMPPQPEDYIHRIGRTGRAHAIGDAISFVAQDELDDLRQLERFIGRGIPRKTAEGFDYTAPLTDVTYDHREQRGRRDDRRPAPSRTPRSMERGARINPGRPERAPFRSADRGPERAPDRGNDRGFDRDRAPQGERDPSIPSPRRDDRGGDRPFRSDRPASPDRRPGPRPSFRRGPPGGGPGSSDRRPASRSGSASAGGRDRAPASRDDSRDRRPAGGREEGYHPTHTPPSRRDVGDDRPAAAPARRPFGRGPKRGPGGR